ncbi:unnamed protein product [Adineta steineri]|uniref:Uncharacterized protein n=1 Tax=Adineta steineri TaxID=433720 RepID=A0A814HQH8_9BILA|nr:unnamed protein product [Adineta steineri]
MNFTLNAPQIRILINLYSNKSILIELGKLQMNTGSRNSSSIKQHGITFDNFSASRFIENDKNELILLEYLSL